MIRGWIILTFLIFSLKTFSQIVFNGYVTDNAGNPLIGAFIEDLSNKDNGAVSDTNGKFKIRLTSDSSLIKISYSGFQSLIVRVDSAQKTDYKFKLTVSKVKDNISDICAMAPLPPALEFGYYGLINDNPIGSHIAYFSRADIFRAYLNYASNSYRNSYIDFELGPYRLGSYEKWKYYRPYIKGIINQSQSSLLLCNEFGLINIGLDADLGLDVGIGFEDNDYNETNILFLTGVRKYLHLPFPFFITYFKFDFVYNDKRCYYLSSLYIELCDRTFSMLTFNIGYQSIFNNNDLVMGLNYKYYFYDRSYYRK